MGRVEENKIMLDNLDYYSDRFTVDDEIVRLLRDISKSLAVIADEMAEENHDKLP